MSMTYAQLSTAIQDYTENNEATFVANIPNFVRQTEEVVYTTVQLPVMRKNATGTLTISNRFLALPTDFLAPYALLITSGTSQISLLQKDVEWLREAFPDSTVTGVPKYYAIYDSTSLLIAKTPSLAFATELHYFYMPTSIVTASTSWLGDNYDTVLLHGALVFAYEFMKGEKDLIEMYDTKFKEGISILKKLEGMTRMDTYRVEQSRGRAA